MRNTKASQVALGGMLTAVAVVIMIMGSLIPVNTYVCPMLCILLNRVILSSCGQRIGWCYYAAVTILSLLMAPDREAAMVYAFLGFYPMVKPRMDRIRPRALGITAKILLFTLAGCCAYGLMIWLMGMEALLAEFREMGVVVTVLMLFAWNVLFLMVDRLLGTPLKRRRK